MRILAAVVALVFVFAACSKKEATTAAKHVGNAVATAASDVASVVKSEPVTLRNIAYDPQRVSVKVGEEVKWTNRDGFPHTVTSDNNSFDSGDVGTDKSYSFRFTQAGTYAYHCQIHGKNRMAGTVVVT
jgi:plastocyanin